MAYKDPCDPRARESRRKHYHNNKEQYVARNKVRETEIRQIVVDAKSKPCADCGVQYPSWVMQFDHLGGKEFNLAQAHKIGSKRRVEAEIAKCEVVCANCHAQRTHERLNA